MPLLQEIWVTDIVEQLYESATFLEHSVDHSPFAVGTTVHVPLAGNAPATERGRTTLPATVSLRPDTERTYTITHRSTDPVVVPDLESFQLSYDKRRSVMAQHLDVLLEAAALDIVHTWATDDTGRIVRTSGAAGADNLAIGATGQRKAITLADIIALARRFDRENVPHQGRFLLMHPVMYYELFSIEALLRADVMGRPSLPKGAITEIFGFNILVKPTLPVYAGTGAAVAPKAIGAATGTGDQLCCLAWQRGAVARVVSGIEVFESPKDPTYYGDVLSARIFCGGAQIGHNGRGVGAIVQATV